MAQITAAQYEEAAPRCAQGRCAEYPEEAGFAVWLLPQQSYVSELGTTAGARPFRRVTWNYVLACEAHAGWWWDGDKPPAWLPHYRLVEAPVVNHSPQWPIEEQA